MGSTPTKAPVPADTSTRHKVLIVEDTTELAEVIQATLERMNIQSFSETHANKALAVYEREKPDVILLDIGLPDMPGWKLLDTIKALVQEKPDYTLPSVIIITAYGDPANRLMGKLQEVTRYLMKPFTPDEVEKVVAEALHQRKIAADLTKDEKTSKLAGDAK